MTRKCGSRPRDPPARYADSPCCIKAMPSSGAGHAVRHLYLVSLIQLDGRVWARGHSVERAQPSHTGTAITNAAVAVCTRATWAVKTPSGAMLRSLVLTLPASAPTIPL